MNAVDGTAKQAQKHRLNDVKEKLLSKTDQQRNLSSEEEVNPQCRKLKEISFPFFSISGKISEEERKRCRGIVSGWVFF